MRRDIIAEEVILLYCINALRVRGQYKSRFVGSASPRRLVEALDWSDPILSANVRSDRRVEFFERMLPRFFNDHILELDARGASLNVGPGLGPKPGRVNLLRYIAQRHAKSFTPSQLEHILCCVLRAGQTFGPDAIGAFRICSDYMNENIGAGVTEDRVIESLQDRLAGRGITTSFARIFLEICFTKRLAAPVPESARIGIRGRADPWFLLAATFGVPCGIPGLGFLFYGSFPIMHPPGNTILVKGVQGSGKTTLASNIAIDVAEKGGFGLYIALEQDLGVLRNTYASFGWYRRSGVLFKEAASLSELLESSQLREWEAEAEAAGCGVFVLTSAASLAVTEIRSILEDSVSEWMSAVSASPKVVVLDPINAVRGTAEEKGEARQLSLEAAQWIRAAGSCLVCVAEEESESELFAESMADTVISTRYGGDRYQMRYLRVEKSRLVPCVRGDSKFVLERACGVRVYPSSSAIVSAKRGRRYVGPGAESRNESWAKVAGDVAGLDALLGARSFQIGTVTGLVGEVGCGKSRLAVQWLIGCLRREHQAGLFVCFQRRAEGFAEMIAERWPEMLVLLKQDREAWTALQSKCSRLQVKYLNTEGLTGPEIISLVETWRAEQGVHGRKGFRLVIDEVAYAESIDGIVDSDPMFMQALVETVKTSYMAAMLCVAEGEGVGPVALERIRSGCDAIIRFKGVDVGGARRRIVFAEKSVASDHPTDPRELVVGGGAVHIAPNFALLTGLRAGEPRAVDVRLLLHHEGTLQKAYHESLERGLRSLLTGQVTVGSEPFANRMLGSMRGNAASGTVLILQVDEPDLDTLDHADVEPIPISVLGEDNVLKACVERVQHSKKKGHLIAAPYFVNLPVLVCEGNVGSGAHEESWSAMSEWVAGRESRVDNTAVVFDFAKGTDENYNCLFLEILVSECGVDLSDLTSRKDFADAVAEGLPAVKALWLVGRRAHSLAQPHPVRSKRDEDGFPLLDVAERASYRRLWYTTVAEMMHRKKLSGVRLERLPGKVETLGTWYLCVPRGGVAGRAGTEIVAELCSRDGAIERFELGVGLPPFRGVLGNGAGPKNTPVGFARSHFATAIPRALIRGAIPDYRRIRSLLAFYLRRILEVQAARKAAFPEKSVLRLMTGLCRELERSGLVSTPPRSRGASPQRVSGQRGARTRVDGAGTERSVGEGG